MLGLKKKKRKKENRTFWADFLSGSILSSVCSIQFRGIWTNSKALLSFLLTLAGPLIKFHIILHIWKYGHCFQEGRKQDVAEWRQSHSPASLPSRAWQLFFRDQPRITLPPWRGILITEQTHMGNYYSRDPQGTHWLNRVKIPELGSFCIPLPPTPHIR